VKLDEQNIIIWNLYSLVRNQVRVSSMGDLIDLDHKAVLDDIKLYVPIDNIKEVFEGVLQCFNIERELSR